MGDRSPTVALVAKMAGLLLAAALLSGFAPQPAPPSAPAPAFVPFDDQAAPPVPDYSRPASWAAGIAGPGAAGAVPEGASPAARHPRADIFYINPTTYLSSTQWNQDIADAAANHWTDVSVVARQASVFNGCCRVFAPRYRQGSHLALSHFAGDGQKALALAYGDVERAFDYYIAHYNKGRPFILVGHSQGALHLAKLLTRRIDGSPLQNRMVAAYVIGLNLLTEGNFPRTYKTIPICDTPTQTGCAIGWNAMLPTADIAKTAADAEQTYIKTFGDNAGKTVLCVNPLTFDRSRPQASAQDNKGAVPGSPGEGPPLPLRTGFVGATCTSGFLVLDRDPGTGMTPLPNGSMHYHDFGLFYENIRENAVLRVDAFLKQHAHPAG